MNCFQISIFAVHEQLFPFRFAHQSVVNCFQISIFAVHEQLYYLILVSLSVVNCFQISIFAVHEQPQDKSRIASTSCELLSN